MKPLVTDLVSLDALNKAMAREGSIEWHEDLSGLSPYWTLIYDHSDHNVVYHGRECSIDIDSVYYFQRNEEVWYIHYETSMEGDDLDVYRFDDESLQSCMVVHSKDEMKEKARIMHGLDELIGLYKSLYGDNAMDKYIADHIIPAFSYFMLLLENANGEKTSAHMTETNRLAIGEYDTEYQLEYELSQPFSIWSNQGANWITHAEIQTSYGSIELRELNPVSYDNPNGSIKANTVLTDTKADHAEAEYEITYKDHNIIRVTVKLTVTLMSDDEN